MGGKKGKKVAAAVADVSIESSKSEVQEVSKKKKTKKKPAAGVVDVSRESSQLEEQEALKKEKAKSEIDDIFGGKKRKKVESEEEGKTIGKKSEDSEVVKLDVNGEIVKPKKPKSGKTSVPGKSLSGLRKKTEDGFTVYSAEELGFNKKGAGGTSLCPFDCDCCF